MSKTEAVYQRASIISRTWPALANLVRQRATARLAGTLALALTSMFALTYILYEPMRITQDCALYLQVGGLMLDGRMPYVDIVDTNPPLILYLNVIPVLAARILHTHLIPTFLVGVWFLTVASVAATRRILKGSFGEDESSQADLVALSLAVFSAAVLLRNQYGQREHLFVLGFFPYLALRFRRWNGGDAAFWPALVAGLVAAIATCIKPHFVLIALAPDLYGALARRSARPLFRPEVLGFVGGGLAYVLHFLAIPEPMRAALFGRWIPLIFSGYHVYDMPLRKMIFEYIGVWVPATVCTVVFVLRPPLRSTAWKLAQPVAIVALTATLSFFIQHKGWAYQAIPAQAALFVIGALVVGQSRLSVSGGEETDAPLITTLALLGIYVVLAGSLAAVTLLAGVLAVHPKTEQRLAESLLGTPVAQAILRYTSPGDPVLVLATKGGSAYPLLIQLDRRPGSRFLVHFPIPMFYDGVRARPGQPFPYHKNASAIPTEEMRFLTELRLDIQSLRPKVILIDDSHTGCQACPPGFRMNDYLTETDFVADAMGNYRKAGRVEDRLLYVRN